MPLTDPTERATEKYVSLITASRAGLPQQVVNDAVSAAKTAYDAQAATSPAAAYDAAKDAVASRLAAVTSATSAQIATAFDDAHTGTATASTAETVASAAKAVASATGAPLSGDLTLSSPSLLGANVRLLFGVLMFLAAVAAGVGLYFDSRMETATTASLVCMSVVAAAAGIIFLIIVNGYGRVQISGTRGSPHDAGTAPAK